MADIDDRDRTETIGPYRIVETLGGGGMGVVYRAHRAGAARDVAIKTVRTRGGSLASIRREVQALARLDHPGVVRIVEDGVQDGLPWYAMELVEGAAFADHLAARAAGPEMETLALGPARGAIAVDLATGADPPPAPSVAIPLDAEKLRESLDVLATLADTLAYLHGEGIVHRDLKPDNVLVRPDGTAVIVDFGLASLAHAGVSREALEATWVSGGTIAYMAPEQAQGLLVDARTDLYALGCILYEIPTGAPPFSGDPMQILWAHAHHAPCAPSDLAASIPPALETLVLRLLAKDPAHRPGHADDVLRELRTLGANRSIRGRRRPRPYVYRPGFAGRDEAIEALDHDLSAARDGAGRVVFVGGESGVGKTRLALEIGSIAHRRGFAVVAGHALPGGPPLAVLRGLLGTVADTCREGDEAARRAILGHGRAVLAPYDLAIASLPALPDEPPAADLPAEAARLRLFRALGHSLGALAERAPILLVLDDLQWADDPSLGFLDHLRRGPIDRMGVVVLGAYRAEEIHDDLARILPAHGERHLALGRLPGSAIASMTRSMLAAEAPPELDAFLAEHGDGNPFFVAEYTRMALSERFLRRAAGGRWRLHRPAEGLPLPRTLGDLVARRIASLTPATRRVLDLASIFGRELSLPLLVPGERAAGGAGERAILAAITELLARHVLEDLGDGGLSFTHDKLRERILEEIPADRLPGLHLRVAETLDRSPDRDRHVPALGGHWEIAGDLSSARSAYLEGARHAARRYAAKTAEPLYRAFLRLSPEPTSLSIAAREELANGVLGLQGRSREAEAELGRAVDEARAIKDPVREGNAMSVLGAVQLQIGRVAGGRGEPARRHRMFGRWRLRRRPSCARARRADP
ncbi:MAG: BREX system ATP-binding domain-containing protein [Acidobacteriota bacterium]